MRMGRERVLVVWGLWRLASLIFCLIPFAKHYTLCCCHTDKPQVHIQMTYPLQGLTREGDALELTCEAIGKPQ